MMEFRSQNSAYFILSPDKKFQNIGLSPEVATKDVISLTVSEERGKQITGTLRLFDRYQVYDQVFPKGSIMEIEWGYKDPSVAIQTLIAKRNNPNEVTGPIFRQGLRCIIAGFSSDFDERGVSTLNVQFKSGFGLMLDRKTFYYTIGTKKSVVTDVMLRMGITTDKMFIDFTKGNERIQPAFPINQINQTDFNFLRELAIEYKTIFRVGNDRSGNRVGMFVDYSKSDKTPFQVICTGGVGNDQLFEWNGGVANVIKGTWEYEYSEDGGGDNVQLSIVDGKTVVNRSEAVTQKVVGYKLNMPKIQAEAQRIKATQGVEGLVKWQSAIMQADNFEDPKIKQFWTQEEYSTAIQAAGMKISIETFGNPLYIPPNTVKFNVGFPEAIRKRTNFKMNKVDHEISKEGYKNKIEIRDFYDLNVRI